MTVITRLALCLLFSAVIAHDQCSAFGKLFNFLCDSLSTTVSIGNQRWSGRWAIIGAFVCSRPKFFQKFRSRKAEHANAPNNAPEECQPDFQLYRKAFWWYSVSKQGWGQHYSPYYGNVIFYFKLCVYCNSHACRITPLLQNSFSLLYYYYLFLFLLLLFLLLLLFYYHYCHHYYNNYFSLFLCFIFINIFVLFLFLFLFYFSTCCSEWESLCKVWSAW